MMGAWNKEIQHKELKTWIEEVSVLVTPKDIYLCDGSDEEYAS